MSTATVAAHVLASHVFKQIPLSTLVRPEWYRQRMDDSATSLNRIEPKAIRVFTPCAKWFARITPVGKPMPEQTVEIHTAPFEHHSPVVKLRSIRERPDRLVFPHVGPHKELGANVLVAAEIQTYAQQSPH
jgi:hypothetical protein